MGFDYYCSICGAEAMWDIDAQRAVRPCGHTEGTIICEFPEVILTGDGGAADTADHLAGVRKLGAEFRKLAGV